MTLTPHAAQRLAHAVVAVLPCSSDPRTIHAWAFAIGASASALRGWCRAAGVRPKHGLDFARVLRAVVKAQGACWDTYDLLDVVDQRTMQGLMARGGLSSVPQSAPPTVETFLARQLFITKPKFVPRSG